MRGYGWGQSKQGGNPGTIALIVTLIGFFVLAWGGLADRLQVLQFVSSEALARPWSLITYPLYFHGPATNAFFLVILFYWMFWVCGSMEERLRPARLWISFFAFALICGISVLIAHFLVAFGQETAGISISGPYLPVAALTVAWAAIYPDTVVRLFFLIPVQAKWVAVVISALVLFGYGANAPIVGLFAVAPMALAWIWGRNGLPWPMEHRAKKRETKHKDAEFHTFIDDVKQREKEREERARLKKLFESSLDEPDEK